MQKVVILFATVILSACATSMTPSQFTERFPVETKSEYYDRAEANEALADSYCKLLVANRSYSAPIGFTVVDDVRNGARGVDEWVQLDGGNAYILNNFKWMTVDNYGSTQLIISFDTMLCSKESPGQMGA